VRCAIKRRDANDAPSILNSWKEIADYLGRGVRTVQRWEHELHLPVHRIGKGKRSPVYANLAELKFWLSTSGVGRRGKDHSHANPGPAPVVRDGVKPIENSRRLLQTARDLAQRVAETSVRQRRQAEDLQAWILKIQARLR
jgi:hypothetical protein